MAVNTTSELIEWRDAAAQVILQRRAERMAHGTLADFVEAAWPIVEPGTKLAWNWHLTLICEELEAVTRGECTELVICIPPGHMKSLLVSVFWPAWEWLQEPTRRTLYLSNDDDLVKRDSRRRREVIMDECYEAAMFILMDEGHTGWVISTDQNEKHYFENTSRGFHQSLSIGAKVTGKRGDAIVIDDPLDAKASVQGTSEQINKRMEECLHVYDHVLASRRNDMEHGPRVLIMQRIHHNDLAGHLIRRGVRHLVLPMEYDPDHPDCHPKDPRRRKGELLFPQRFPQSVVDQVKATPEANLHYQAQYQQNPSEVSGNLFRREWFRYYEDAGDYYVCRYPAGRERRVLKRDCWRFVTVDLALSEREMADYTVIQVWDGERAKMADFEMATTMFLVDQYRARIQAPDAEAAMLSIWTRYSPIAFCIEDAHYGSAVLQRFARDGLPVRKLKADRDKVTRSRVAQVWMESEKVFFPAKAPWLGELEDELLTFPQGTHDDQVDTLSYAVDFANDRDWWQGGQSKPFKRNSLEDKLGYNELLNPTPTNGKPVFGVDAIRRSSV